MMTRYDVIKAILAGAAVCGVAFVLASAIIKRGGKETFRDTAIWTLTSDNPVKGLKHDASVAPQSSKHHMVIPRRIYIINLDRRTDRLE